VVGRSPNHNLDGNPIHHLVVVALYPLGVVAAQLDALAFLAVAQRLGAPVLLVRLVAAAAARLGGKAHHLEQLAVSAMVVVRRPKCPEVAHQEQLGAPGIQVGSRSEA
jgi:hypothetical protein